MNKGRTKGPRRAERLETSIDERRRAAGRFRAFSGRMWQPSGTFWAFPCPGSTPNTRSIRASVESGPRKCSNRASDGRPKKASPTPMLQNVDVDFSVCRPPEFKTYVCCPLADHLVVQRSVERLHLVREGGH